MKKIFIFITLMLMFAGVDAQSYKAARGTRTYFTYTGVASDTIIAAAKAFDFLIDMAQPYYFDAYFDIDTLLVAGANPDVTFTFYGSNDDVTYYQIGDAIVFGATADTIIRFNNLKSTYVNDTVPTENAVLWRYLRLSGTGASNARVELQKAVFAIMPKRY